MHPSVRDAWVAFNTPLEGLVNRIYADVKGLITTGMGNLIDPIGAALSLPWELPDGKRASQDQITAAWMAVKHDNRAAERGWKHAIGIPANNIHLAPDAVNALILSRLDLNDKSMSKRFADWEDRPADAQLAIHSMAWAMGPNFWAKFPNFTKAFAIGNYRAAAGECAISPAVGTIVERNRRNRDLLLYAADLPNDPSVLNWSPGSKKPTTERPPAA